MVTANNTEYIKRNESESTKNVIKQNLAQQKQIEKKRLSYNEQQELKELPKKIEKLEAEQNQLQALVATPEFYQRTPENISSTLSRLKELEDEIILIYQRWEELEQIAQGK